MVKKVTWSAENDRKLLLQLLPLDTKNADLQALAALYDGATPKAIEERIAKLKREKKKLNATDSTTSSPAGASNIATAAAASPSKAKARGGRAPKTPTKAGVAATFDRDATVSDDEERTLRAGSSRVGDDVFMRDADGAEVGKGKGTGAGAGAGAGAKRARAVKDVGMKAGVKRAKTGAVGHGGDTTEDEAGEGGGEGTMVVKREGGEAGN